MTRYERLYCCSRPLLTPLHRKMHGRLKELARKHPNPEILDVGGRKSRCTIGIPARISVSDLPRASRVQQELGLGFNEEVVEQLGRGRRSNICRVVYDDMRNSSFRDGLFDCILAVEVLEHVDRDKDFVSEVYRVLKPGGVFLMSTPNGDFVPNRNPDHKRHYKRRQLEALLKSRFESVEVEYAVHSGRFSRWSAGGWTAQSLARKLLSLACNVIWGIQSRGGRLADRAHGTSEIIAAAVKQGTGTR